MEELTADALGYEKNGSEFLKHWKHSASRVAEERVHVEDFLNQGGRAYGFSTFLGHLDNQKSSVEQSELILESHLVGEPTILTDRQLRCITGVKLCQLAAGSSGLSSRTYMALIDGYAKVNEVGVDLHASYGSGDVVPAAWWVYGMKPYLPELSRGDLIALINGNFVQLGLLISLLPKISEFSSNAISTMNRILHSVATSGFFASEVQLPVSLRDVEVLSAQLDTVRISTFETCTRKLHEPSFNPMFDFSGGEPKVMSNSSFLGFELTRSTSEVAGIVSLASSYLSAAFTFLCEGLSSSLPAVEGVAYVQPPKVVKAYHDNISVCLAGYPPNLQYASKGIEDIADGGMILINKLETVLELAGKELRTINKYLDADTA